MKRLFLVFYLCTTIFAAYGQEISEKVNLSLEVANNFVWRGFANNTMPVMQSSVTFSPTGKLLFGTWASTPLSTDLGEQPILLDVFFEVQLLPALSLFVTSYYVYGTGWTESYFNLKKEETGHAFDAQLKIGTDDFPLRAMISTIFAGADLNEKGKNNYSTYIELGYGKSGKHIDWEIFAGAVPMKSGFYGLTGADVVNLGFKVTKSFEITPTWSLPVSMKFTVNPARRAAFLTAAVALF